VPKRPQRYDQLAGLAGATAGRWTCLAHAAIPEGITQVSCQRGRGISLSMLLMSRFRKCCRHLCS